jgi:pyruvate-formate lyase-activating enzyme
MAVNTEPRVILLAQPRNLYRLVQPLKPDARLGPVRLRRIAFDALRHAWWLELSRADPATGLGAGPSTELGAGQAGAPLPALYLQPLEAGARYLAHSRTLGLYHRGPGTPELTQAAHLLAAIISTNESTCSPGQWEASLADLRCGALVVHGTLLEVRLTRACNQACPMCNSAAALDNLVEDVERLLRLLPSLRAAGVQQLTLTGGEPTLVQRLPELIAAAHQAGLAPVRLQTNSLRFADEGYAARFQGASRPDLVFVSFQSHLPEVYDRVVGREGTFPRAVEGLRNLLAAGHSVCLNHVLQQANLPHLDGLVDGVAGLLGTRLEMTFSVVVPSGRQQGRAEELPPYPALVPALERAVARAQALGIPVHLSEMCGLPRCVLVGHPALQAAVEGEGPSDPRVKVKLPGCARCVHDPRCSGVWPEYLQAHGEAGLVPVAGEAAP